MERRGLDAARGDTRKSMDQIVGALVGIATVLSAVFVPMAFWQLGRRYLPAVFHHHRIGMALKIQCWSRWY
ncbi:MAG: hypothetical protein IPK63_22050 [Candidatus Competibacteraceae bacterium]|nr:hypothetical protein [Candidatus Competibacteraceae bacterium]